MTELTSSQRATLDAVLAHIAEKGYPPSVRDICSRAGFKSSATAHHHLTALERKGYIERGADTPRGIRVVGMVTDQERIDMLARALADTRPRSGSCHVCGRCMRDEECRKDCMLAWSREHVARLEARS